MYPKNYFKINDYKILKSCSLIFGLSKNQCILYLKISQYKYLDSMKFSVEYTKLDIPILPNRYLSNRE